MTEHTTYFGVDYWRKRAEQAELKLSSMKNMNGCELHQQMLEVMNHQNLEWTEEYAKLELRIKELEEALGRAQTVVKQHSVDHDPNCDGSTGGICTCEYAPMKNLIGELKSALRSIIEIGKRDMSNPKYDGYFEHAKKILADDPKPEHEDRLKQAEEQFARDLDNV